jgi:hypothetical protein
MSGYDGRGTKFDVIAVRGADMAFTLTVTSGGSPVNLSAATIDAEVYGPTGAVVDTLTDSVGGAGSNVITLSFTDAETALLTASSYRWTLWVTRGGDKRPWLAGRFLVVDSTNGVTSTTGDVTLTVDGDLSVAVDVDAIGTFGGAVVQASPPANPNEGDFWLDEDDLILYAYYGSTWVSVTGGGGDLLAANNLSDVANTATALTNLGAAPANGDDEAYGAGWNGDLTYPTKNAVYDKVETLGGGTESVFLPVTSMIGVTPAASGTYRLPYIALTDSAELVSQGMIMLPDDWVTFNAALLYSQATANVGDWRVQVNGIFYSLGEDMSQSGTPDWGDTNPRNVAAPAVLETLSSLSCATGATNGAGLLTHVYLRRFGTDGGDTLTGSIYAHGVKFTKAS